MPAGISEAQLAAIRSINLSIIASTSAALKSNWDQLIRSSAPLAIPIRDATLKELSRSMTANALTSMQHALRAASSNPYFPSSLDEGSNVAAATISPLVMQAALTASDQLKEAFIREFRRAGQFDVDHAKRLSQLCSRLPIKEMQSAMSRAALEWTEKHSKQLTQLAVRLASDFDLRESMLGHLETASIDFRNFQSFNLFSVSSLEGISEFLQTEDLFTEQGPSDGLAIRLSGLLDVQPSEVRAAILTLLVTLLAAVIHTNFLTPQHGFSPNHIKATIDAFCPVVDTLLVTDGRGLEMRSSIRVTTRALSVYRRKSRKSGRILMLPAGQLVVVKRKSRNWSEVIVPDATEKPNMHGWVFSRHLRKL